MFYKVSNGGTALEFEFIPGNAGATVSCQVGDYILVSGSNYGGLSGLSVTGGNIVYDKWNEYGNCYARQSVIKATSTSVKIDRASRGAISITKIKS
jgi:hypothetical protein